MESTPLEHEQIKEECDPLKLGRNCMEPSEGSLKD